MTSNGTDRAGTVRSHQRPGSNAFDIAVSFAQNQRGEVLEKPIMDSLKVGGGKPRQGYPAVLYNPHRTLQKDGSVVEGFKPDTIHDALHKPTGNKQPFIVGQPEGGDRSALDPLPDGRRYAACGDGVVGPVAEWIARRLAAVIAAGA